MIRLKHGVVVLLGGTLLGVAACGGTSNPGDLGGGGAAGSTGSLAGATASGGQSVANAGSSSESGSVGVSIGGSDDSSGGSTGVAGTESGAAGGETSAGGALGVGGHAAGGMSGASSGGAGGESSCPASTPADRSMCSALTAAACLYVGESCSCRAGIVVGPGPVGSAGAAAGGATGAGGAGSVGASRTWRCTGSGAACPATAPATGDMCTNPTGAGAAALDCPYPDGKTCRCTNRRWECTEPPPPACPAKQPTGTCSAIQSCNYGTAAMRVRCACDGSSWACDMAGGAAPRCMAKAPAALATGDTCTGIGACPAAGATAASCVCNGKTVACN